MDRIEPKQTMVILTLEPSLRRIYKTYVNTEDEEQIRRIETKYMAPIIEETGALDRWNNDTQGHL